MLNTQFKQYKVIAIKDTHFVKVPQSIEGSCKGCALYNTKAPMNCITSNQNLREACGRDESIFIKKEPKVFYPAVRIQGTLYKEVPSKHYDYRTGENTCKGCHAKKDKADLSLICFEYCKESTVLKRASSLA